MYVLNEYRGIGIGQNMLNKAIEFAKSVGYSKMVLSSSSKFLKPARNLYLKNGFVDIPRYTKNFRADIFMEKVL